MFVRNDVGFILGALLALTSARALAGDAAPPAAPSTSAPTAEPIAIPAPGQPATAAKKSATDKPEQAGLDPTFIELTRLDRETEVVNSKNKFLTKKVEQQALETKLNVTTGNADVPELVGIYGYGDNMVAEFLIGRAILTARPGDWVTSQYQLGRILSNGVEVHKRGDKKPRTVLFGRVEMPAGAAGAQSMQGVAVSPPGPEAFASPVITAPRQ